MARHVCVDCGDCPQGIYDFNGKPLDVPTGNTPSETIGATNSTSTCVWCKRHGVELVADSEQCYAVQRERGCHACGRIGCWRLNPSCTFLKRQRPKHVDAPTTGKAAANLFERSRVRITHHSDDTRVRVDFRGLNFFKGSASRKGCNCLIHTILQCLIDNDIKCKAKISWIRERLRERYPDGDNRVTASNYLDLRNHWRAVVDLLGISARDHGYDQAVQIRSQNFNVTAVLEDTSRVVEQDGDGPIGLYILNEGNSHFVPLLRNRDV